MTLATTTSRFSFAGNGVTTAFSYPAYFLTNADLVVILRVNSTGVETTQVITTNYTVAGAGVVAGGTVTMVVAPTALQTLVIFRDPAATQELDLVENDNLPAESLERSLDKSTMLAQRVKNLVERAAHLSEGFSSSFNTVLPALLVADTAIVINPTATGFATGPTITDIANAAPNAAAAAASASAAASSAIAAASSASASAVSAAAAAAAASSSLWDDVVYKVFGDSPIAIVDADSGNLIEIDCTGGNVVVNLPQISTLTLSAPWSVGIKKTDATANTITINRFGTDTIDGATTKIVSRQHAGTTLIPDTDSVPDKWSSLTYGEVPIAGAIVGTTDTQDLTNKRFLDAVGLAEIATPSTPASGFSKVYSKSDNNLYLLDDAGSEKQLSGLPEYVSTLSDQFLLSTAGYSNGEWAQMVNGSVTLTNTGIKRWEVEGWAYLYGGDGASDSQSLQANFFEANGNNSAVTPTSVSDVVYGDADPGNRSLLFINNLVLGNYWVIPISKIVVDVTTTKTIYLIPLTNFTIAGTAYMFTKIVAKRVS